MLLLKTKMSSALTGRNVRLSNLLISSCIGTSDSMVLCNSLCLHQVFRTMGTPGKQGIFRAAVSAIVSLAVLLTV